MQRFAADQLHREREHLPPIAARGVPGKQSIVTQNTCHAVVRNTRRLLRAALESGKAQRFGLNRAFITAMSPAGTMVRRTRPPFPDGVARAPADEANRRKLTDAYDPFDCRMRDVWEAIIITGRRYGEVLKLVVAPVIEDHPRVRGADSLRAEDAGWLTPRTD
ncbi:hypothetical protein [Saccharopolyspora pogona]|uniref:hypothetical protein n=1 Tax=Saccharopolyspora pogona TaxID=333966 RepID=UPI001682AA73|nr:hypothetical protein [Saccharopolyspora pogona]